MLPMEGVWVRSLVRELRSHMLWDVVKKMRGDKKVKVSGSESEQERLSVLPAPTALLSVPFIEMY